MIVSRTGFALRQRKGVKEGRDEVVVEAVGALRSQAVPFWMEVRGEELLGHRRAHVVASRSGERCQDHGRIHVALVIGGKDDRSVDVIEMLAPVDAQPGECPS